MGEPLDVIVEPTGVEPLDRLHATQVKLATALGQQARVDDLVDERVLEGVLEGRGNRGLVDEFGRHEAAQRPTHDVLGQVDDGLHDREGHILADHGSTLEQGLLVRRQAVEASEDKLLDGVRYGERVGAVVANGQGQFFQEEIALGLDDDAIGDIGSALGSENLADHGSRLCRGQWTQGELGGVGPPGDVGSRKEMAELEEQARLADSRLSDDAHDLATVLGGGGETAL